MNDSLPIELKSNDGKAKYSFKTRYDYVSEFFILLSSAHECVMQKNEKTGDFIY